ncbi:hypothetical protein BMR1_01G02130 [Babesia microti strain RI]|uniref:Uncharacterized protein n=1 Tax=Babesia microti (strain RI) TaxID=1133968 RepID=I7J8I9_BABMR|nr:hypothetical protein BMR1_01G02130 [Babesia microti strain RI]CCF72884.1 hypothetical protein BMR1_01G02130 [Babesia microti strain RI]|eukprot:XP_012647493.1 hypothetical protein BMR1_01G02130 [Babesia microti strain RI]
MFKKRNHLSIYIPEGATGKLALSQGFRVYRNFDEKHSFYRDGRRRKRDVKAVEHHFPGITQILKSVKNMENECVYCRLERDSEVDQVQAVLFELLKIATGIIASEQAYSKELEYRMDLCTLFLDENFHLLRNIKSLQEQNIILDNELIKCLDNNDTEYAETVFIQCPNVKTHNIFLQDISQGWDSIDWRALELGECKLKRTYLSQESDSQLDEDVNGGYFDNLNSFANIPLYDYTEQTPTAKAESPISNLSTVIKSQNINEFITPKSQFPASNTNDLISLPFNDFDTSVNDIPLHFTYGNVSTPSIREGDIVFKPLFPDLDPDHSYKSLDSCDISHTNDRDLCTFSPFSGDDFSAQYSNSNHSSLEEEVVVEKYRISDEDLNLFEQLFTSRVQYYSEGSDTIRLLNAENSYLYNIIQNKLVIGNEIDLKELGEAIKLKEKFKIHKEHWDRLEKLLSSYLNQNFEGEIGKFYVQNPNLDVRSMDEDVVKYLSVFASISALLSERVFEKILDDIVINKGDFDHLIASLNKISGQKYAENHLLKDSKLQLSIQTELCNRLTSINNISLICDSQQVVEMKNKVSQLNEKITALESEKNDLLADCKNAANVISMMELEIQEKSVNIEKLNTQITNLQAKANIDMVKESNKYNTNPIINFSQEKVPKYTKPPEISNSYDSMEGIMKKALWNCLKDLEYAESYTGCTTLVSSESASDIMYDSDTDGSDISITRVQNHPILPKLLSMLERLHSRYMGLIRALKEQCVTINRTDFNKYVSLMDGLASLIRRYNTSVKYDHEIETIQIMMHSEYTLSSSNILYLLNIMARLSELAQIVLLDRELDINSSVSRTNARLERAEDRIKLLEKEKMKIIAEKDDLKSNISGLKKEIDRLKYPLDRLDRSRHPL